MAVSKRTRFEVLRRDNHQCRYCGLSADESPLTIDHVVPVSLGGSDAPDNLVAACKDCNSGKSSSAPDAAQVAQVAEDSVRWAQARHAAIRQTVERTQKARDEFLAIWNRWTYMDGPKKGQTTPLPGDWFAAVDTWTQERLPISIIKDAVDIAMSAKRVPEHSIFAYMLGVMRNKLAEIDKETRSLLIGDADTKASEVDAMRSLLSKYYYRNGEYGALVGGYLSIVVDGSDNHLQLEVEK